jgi:hypothetical protein
MKTRDSLPAEFSQIEQEIILSGYAFRSGREIQAAMKHCGLDTSWPLFASSWNDLGLDLYMADGGRYRRRRFASFHVADDVIRRKPHQPHYQSRDYNILNGGIQRCFAPILEEVANHDFMLKLLGDCGRLFDIISPSSTRSSPWHAEVHQFRIEAGQEESGLPTPEGMHRDGVDWVCVVLINRQNVSSGVTRIFDNQSGSLNEFTLTDALDTIFLDDIRVQHGVTPISRLDSKREGFRDILVLTYRHDPV